jgi:hypothetical protein
MPASRRWILRLAVPLTLLLAFVSLQTPAEAAGDADYSVSLRAGLNEVVYRGPSAPAHLVAAQIDNLVSMYRWDPLSQRHEQVDTNSVAALDWAVEPGDVLWLRVATDTAWRIPLLGSASAYDFHSGWNTYGWPSSLTTDEFVEALASRLRGLWLKDSVSGRFAVYAPGLDGSEQALSLATPFAPVWVLLSDGPLLTVGLAGGTQAELLPAADASSAIPVAADATEVERAIVRVQAKGLAGSGFIVAEDLVLTSAHLIEIGEQVALRFFDGLRASGQVTALDAALDLAVIRVDGMPDNVRRLDWESASDPALTTAVWVWGFPLEGNLIQSGFSPSVSVSGGFISAIRKRAGVSFLQTDAAMNPGNSGGAITLRDGRVIGVATATFSVSGDDAEGIHFALDLTAHRAQLLALLASA